MWDWSSLFCEPLPNSKRHETSPSWPYHGCASSAPSASTWNGSIYNILWKQHSCRLCPTRLFWQIITEKHIQEKIKKSRLRASRLVQRGRKRNKARHCAGQEQVIILARSTDDEQCEYGCSLCRTLGLVGACCSSFVWHHVYSLIVAVCPFHPCFSPLHFPAYCSCSKLLPSILVFCDASLLRLFLFLNSACSLILFLTVASLQHLLGVLFLLLGMLTMFVLKKWR